MVSIEGTGGGTGGFEGRIDHWTAWRAKVVTVEADVTRSLQWTERQTDGQAERYDRPRESCQYDR